jgi:ABC-type hemin transport system substrate-binding protein
MKITGCILRMDMVNSNGDIYEKMPTIVIGEPIKFNHEVIGQITSAEVKEDYIEATAELNDMGKKLFKEIG